MSERFNKPIALIGLKSCGKSTIGHALADQMGCAYIDTDYVVELLYFEEYGVEENFRAIYKKLGNDRFRALEHQALKRIVDMDEDAVIATGGSTLLYSQNAELVKRYAHLIYLKASPETLKKRWREDPPGFIDMKQFDQQFDDYYQARAEKYEALADTVVEVDHRSVRDVIERVL